MTQWTQEVDEALALSLQYEFSEFTINDAAIAQIQQQQEVVLASLSDDEELAKQLQALEGERLISLSDDEEFAKSLQERELNGSTSTVPHLDVPSTSASGSIGVNIADEESHDPANVDLDPSNMTYEELNELGTSIGDVKKGLSKRQIARLPTYAYGSKPATSWLRKQSPVTKDSQCSICQTEFTEGDKLLTLPCAHGYHKACISRWLQQNKVCCVCKAEVKP